MKKFKKLSVMLSLVLCVSILFGGSVFATSEKEDNKSATVENAYNLAIDALSTYNHAIYQYEDVELAQYIATPTLLNYLNNKIDTLQIKSIHPTFDKVNYVDTYTLLSHEVVDNLVKLDIKSVSEYNYADLLDVKSSSSVVAKIIVDNSVNAIVDWYMQGDMYDEEVLGINNDTTLSISSMKVKSSSSVADAQNKVNKAFSDYYGSLLNTKNIIDESETPAKNMIVKASATTVLDKSAICSWAQDNKASNPPSSGDGSTPYKDFNDPSMGNNYDCTNFVSHALLAGGATKNTSSTGDTGWYYNGPNKSNRSTSWSGVPNLYTFLTRSATTKGPKGSSKTYSFFSSSSRPPYSEGDVIQFHNGSIWRHSGIISGYYSPDGNNLGAIVVGRSGIDMYNDNEKADDIYPYQKRVIVLYANLN